MIDGAILGLLTSDSVEEQNQVVKLLFSEG